MKRLVVLMIVACGNASSAPWATPTGWKAETIPFPLDFAPSLTHRGVEELRFAPGFFEPGSPGYWSYAFTWRTEDGAALEPPALGAELVTYFKGLVAAVDEAHRITAPDEIAATVTADGNRFKVVVHTFDAFKTAQPIDLVGSAERTACGSGALWVFVLAPEASPMRKQLDDLAATARCGTPTKP